MDRQRRPACQHAIILTSLEKRYRLRGTTLQGRRFVAVDLSGTVFEGADCDRTAFVGVDLSCAEFCGANLSDAVFVRCDVRGARFCGADVQGAKFLGCFGIPADTAAQLRGQGARVAPVFVRGPSFEQSARRLTETERPPMRRAGSRRKSGHGTSW